MPQLTETKNLIFLTSLFKNLCKKNLQSFVSFLPFLPKAAKTFQVSKVQVRKKTQNLEFFEEKKCFWQNFWTWLAQVNKTKDTQFCILILEKCFWFLFISKNIRNAQPLSHSTLFSSLNQIPIYVTHEMTFHICGTFFGLKMTCGSLVPLNGTNILEKSSIRRRFSLAAKEASKA